MSGAERKRFEIGETKEFVFNRDRWRCRVCNKPVNPFVAQLGHRIPQSKAMIKKYGKEIIHHPVNLLTTCSLECNNKVQVNYEQEQLAIVYEILHEHKRERA